MVRKTQREVETHDDLHRAVRDTDAEFEGRGRVAYCCDGHAIIRFAGAVARQREESENGE